MAALRKYGPMHVRSLAEHLDWTVERAARTIINTRRLHPGKLIRVIGYERVQDGKGKDLSIYAAGAGDDIQRRAVHERRRRLTTQARYRERNRAIINAKHRAWRAKKKGEKAVVNPWMQLAHPEVRSFMTIAANDVRKAA